MPDTPDHEMVQLRVGQADSKRALAVLAHLRQIISTAATDTTIRWPLQMEQPELVLSSASLRALFFDTKPILISFLADRDITLYIECIESNQNLLLLSRLSPEEAHISHLMMSLLLDPEMRETHPLDSTHQVFHIPAIGDLHPELLKQADVWMPPESVRLDHNLGIGIGSDGGPVDLAEFTRRRVPLAEWGLTRVGFLKSVPITRRAIITYAANKLGGVHYDSGRAPSKDDEDAFRSLAEAYDWRNQAIVHGALVATAVACVEVAASPEIRSLHAALEAFHNGRQARLVRGERLPEDRGPAAE